MFKEKYATGMRKRLSDARCSLHTFYTLLVHSVITVINKCQSHVKSLQVQETSITEDDDSMS